MILSTHGVLASQIASFDADAVAFFDRVTTAGGSLTLTEKQAVNTLVVDMKAYGIWSAMKAVYPMVGASAAACAQNLKSSSFTGTFTSGWTFASTGATPNGTSAYMDTAFNPTSNLSDFQSAHISVYTRTQSRSGIDLGCSTSGSEFSLCADLNLSGIYAYGNIGNRDTRNVVSQTSIGFFLVNRQNNSLIKLSQSNTLLNTNTLTNTTTKPNTSAKLGGSDGLFTARQQAFASIGDGLTDTQASDFYTAVQAFNTTLSRQV